MAFGCGAAAYFAAPTEPWQWALIAATVLGALGWMLARRWGRSRLLVILSALLTFAAAGATTGSVKTALVAGPVAPAQRRPVTVEGWVVDVLSVDATRQRLLIAPTHVSGLPWRRTPIRVRLSLKAGGVMGPGAPVRMMAVLGPPPSPAAPGSYDFARDAWFAQIGGSGLALKPPEMADLPRPSMDVRVEMAVNAARWSLARRLVDRMGEHRGGLAAALTTGHQAWLDPGDVQAMRDSGLAHILSISGVHMAIVGGFVFAVLRLAIAAWPWAALRWPGKKVAAAGALIAILAYLVLSGAPPPAIRSALTAGIALTAVMLDRRALSLHSLAVAALVVMAFQPEAVLQPGFQMSFAATAALLALAESWPHGGAGAGGPWWLKGLRKARAWLVGGAMVSLVAGLATDPFSIQHFNRITLWGLPANIGAEVLSSLVVMPALAVGVVAEACGGGGPVLAVAGWGLDGIAAIARVFAAAPHAVAPWSSAPAVALPISFLGLLAICIVKGPLRWLALPAFAAVWLWPRPAAPIAWIAGEGANAAVAVNGQAVLLRPRSQRFAFELWAHRRAWTLPPDAAAASEASFTCKRDFCAPLPSAPLKLAGWWRTRPPTTEDLAKLCPGAQIVVLRTGSAGEANCPGARVVDEDALSAGGSAEVYRNGRALRLVWSQPLRGTRPWTAPAPVSDSGG